MRMRKARGLSETPFVSLSEAVQLLAFGEVRSEREWDKAALDGLTDVEGVQPADWREAIAALEADGAALDAAGRTRLEALRRRAADHEKALSAVHRASRELFDAHAAGRIELTGFEKPPRAEMSQERKPIPEDYFADPRQANWLMSSVQPEPGNALNGGKKLERMRHDSSWLHVMLRRVDLLRLWDGAPSLDAIEDARNHLTSWLRYNSEASRRTFAAGLQDLTVRMTARGLRNSGQRIKEAIALARGTLSALTTAAMDKLRTLPELGAGPKLVKTVLDGLRVEFTEMTDDVVRDASPDRGSDDLWNDVRSLQARLREDLDSAIKGIEAHAVDGPGSFVPPFLSGWDVAASRAELTRESRLPIMIGLRRAKAWVAFRDEQTAMAMDSVDDLHHRPEGISDPLWETKFREVLVARKLIAFGLLHGRGWEPIPPSTFALETALSLGPSVDQQYDEIRISRYDLLALFPPLPGATDKGNATKRAFDGRSRLPDGQLQKWWSGLKPARRAATQKDLLAAARAAFPDHKISRDRIYKLTGSRKPGPRQISGIRTGKLPEN